MLGDEYDSCAARFPEQEAVERLQDFSVDCRVRALAVLDLEMTADQVMSSLNLELISVAIDVL